MWEALKGDREGMIEHPQLNARQSSSHVEATDRTKNDAASMEPNSRPQIAATDERPSESIASDNKGQMRYERIIFETSNATSLNSNRDTALDRKAHLQGIQEACLTPSQIDGDEE